MELFGEAEVDVTPFGFDDKPKDFTVINPVTATEHKAREDKTTKEVEIEVPIPIISNTVSILDKYHQITTVLKVRMGPRELHQALKEIKIILNS